MFGVPAFSAVALKLADTLTAIISVALKTRSSSKRWISDGVEDNVT